MDSPSSGSRSAVRSETSRMNGDYSSKTNKMQRYTIVFIITNALHVSGRSSAHHQELETVYTASGICLTVNTVLIS